MSTDTEMLTPREIRGKWGYVDKDGKWIIDPIFDWAEDFSENLAAVEINGKIGYVDVTGDFVIERCLILLIVLTEVLLLMLRNLECMA